MGSFEGVAEVYQAGRYDYPAELARFLVDQGVLTKSSLVVDLGAGTGQLVRLVAGLADQVVAVEPEPDMYRVGRSATSSSTNVRWVLDRDAGLAEHFGRAEIDLVVIGNAFHHMNGARLLEDLDRLVSPTGAVCIASSSVPVWLQDTEWSAALLAVLEAELGPLDRSGVPDGDAARAALAASVFRVATGWRHQREERRSGESIVEEVVSSGSGRLPATLVERLEHTIERFAEAGTVAEVVEATAVLGRRRQRS